VTRLARDPFVTTSRLLRRLDTGVFPTEEHKQSWSWSVVDRPHDRDGRTGPEGKLARTQLWSPCRGDPMTKWLACVVALLCSVLAVGGGGMGVRQQEQEPVRQVLVSFEDLDYPYGPRAGMEQGLVVVDLRLDDKGVPVSASALTGPKLLIPYATANAKQWRFEPNAQRRAIVVYDFSIGGGACHDPSRSLFLLRRPNFAEIKSCDVVISR